MSELSINGVGKGVDIQKRQSPAEADAKAAGFDSVLDEVLNKLNQVQGNAEKAVQELAAGGDVFQAIVAMEKADMDFQLMVEVRNKLISAYEEIMRMQV